MLRTILYASAAATMCALASAQSACHDYVLISARGTFEPQGPSVAFVDMINTTLTTLPNGIEYDTVYPASTNLTGAFIGVEDIIRYITAGVISCPQQKYALMGYSQGASAVNIALHNITNTSSLAYQAIKAVVNVGNPGHVPNAVANVDQYGGNLTRAGLGWFYLGGAGAVPNAYYLDDKVLDICYEGDTVCELPANGTGGVSPPHLLYSSTPKVQQMGANFLVFQLQDYSFNSPAITPTYASTASASASTSASTCTATTTPSSSGKPTSAATSLLVFDVAFHLLFTLGLTAWLAL